MRLQLSALLLLGVLGFLPACGPRPDDAGTPNETDTADVSPAAGTADVTPPAGTDEPDATSEPDGAPTEVAVAEEIDIPSLTAQLETEDAAQWVAAAKQLARMGSHAAPAVDALIQGLTNEDPLVRAHAARTLGLIGEAAKPAIPELAKLIADEDVNVRRATVRAVRGLKPAPEVGLPLLIKVLEDSDPSVVLPALGALAEDGGPPDEFLKTALANDRAQYWALIIISEMGSGAKGVVPEILPLVSHEQPEVRMQALLALGEIGPDAKDGADAIAQALDDEQTDCRSAAIFALTKIGAVDDTAKDKLAGLVESPDKLLSMVAAWALAHLEPENNEAVELALKTLVPQLASDNHRLRTAAAKGVIDLDPPSELLRPLLEETMPRMSREALADFADHAAQLGPEIVPRLRESITNEALRDGVIMILARLGEDAKEAVPELVEALTTADSDELKAEIQFTLAEIGTAAAPAVAELIKSLKSDHEEVRQGAVYALGRIGPPADAAVDALTTLVGTGDEETRTLCVWSLLKIRPGNEEIIKIAVPVLVEALKDDLAVVRSQAAGTLGEIGPAAASALPALEEVRKDPNRLVRQDVEAAIQQIQQ